MIALTFVGLTFPCTVQPVFIDSPRNFTIDEFSNITLECSVSGNPPPAITWVHDGVAIGEEEGTVHWEVSLDSNSVSVRS